MAGPIEVDATVKAMVELINRVARDTAFRQLCETDMKAALVELGSAPAEGVAFDYLHDAEGHRLRVERGGEVTTCVLTSDGELRIDSKALGEVASRPAELADAELDDEELLAVAGGSGCGSYDWGCQAAYVCYGVFMPGWGAENRCTGEGNAVCVAYKYTGGSAWYIPCSSR